MAAERISTFERSKAISHAEMMARFGMDEQVEQ